MDKKIILFFILILLAAFIVLVIPVLHPFAEKSRDVKSTLITVEEREKIAARLFGKNISECDYIKNVFPEVYDSGTQCDIALQQEQMNWPNLSRYQGL